MSNYLITKLGLWSLFGPMKKIERFWHFWHRKLTSNIPTSWFLTTLCHLSVTDKKNTFCNVWFFSKNEACINCPTHKRHNPKLCIGIASFEAFLWKNQFSEWCLMFSLNVPKNSKIKFASLYVWNWTVLIVWAIFLSETSGTWGC